MNDNEALDEQINALIKARIGEVLKDSENQAIVVEWFRNEASVPPTITRAALKMLVPILVGGAGAVSDWLGQTAADRLRQAFFKLPYSEPIVDRLQQAIASIDLRAGAMRRFDQAVERVSPAAAELGSLLADDLTAHLAQLEVLGELKAEIAEVSRLIGALANPQPVTSLWLVPDGDDNRFLYRSRSIPVVGRAKAMDGLEAFLNYDGMFRWHLVFGSGGVGKSRLALEFLIRRGGAYSSNMGFLPKEELGRFDWHRWQPLVPTLLVVDYAAREAGPLADMMRALAVRDDLQCPVRLILLERHVNAPWFERVIGEGTNAAPRIEACWSEKTDELTAPHDVWPIIRFMADGALDETAREATLRDFETVDPQMRPLFAAFYGDAIRRRRQPRQWSRVELVRDVLKHEQGFWKEAGLSDRHRNLLACSTTTAGVPVEWLDHRFEFAGSHPHFWPEGSQRDMIGPLSQVFGYEIISDIPPIEPDILGEVYLIEWWRAANAEERSSLLDLVAYLSAWAGDTVDRMVSDFPDDAPIDFVFAIIGTSWRDLEMSRAECIYNIVTGFAPHNAHAALRSFRLFETVPFSTLTSSYGSECLNDAAQNFIVGVAEPERNSIRAVLAAQLRLWRRAKRSRTQDIALCGSALSAIARLPQSQPREFLPMARRVAALARAYPQDEEFEHEAATCLTNYVNLFDPMETAKARYWAREALNLVGGYKGPEWDELLTSLSYHLFLLELAEGSGSERDMYRISEGEVSSALDRVVAFDNRFRPWKGTILEQFRSDGESWLEER